MLDELRKLLKHTTVFSVGNMLNKAVGFLMIPVYTHYLSPADYGILELLDLSLMLTSVVLTMWMNAAVLRCYYEYDDERDRNQVISTFLFLAAALGVVGGTLGMLFARNLAGFVLRAPQFYVFFRLISISLFMSSINTVAWSYLRAKQRSTLIVAMNFVSLVINLSLNIYFIVFLRWGVIGMLYGSLVATSVLTTTITIITLREVKVSFAISKIAHQTSFGFSLVFASIAAFTLNFSDRFFLQRFSDVSHVGIYALGYKFGYMLNFLIVQPFDIIWGSRMYEIDKEANAGEVFSRILNYYALALITAALGISLVIKEVIGIVADRAFFDAYKIVPLVALSYVFAGLNSYFVAGIYIKKKTFSVGSIGIATATINLILNVVLISRYEAMGAAVATATSFFVMAALAFIASQRARHIPYKLRKVFTALTLAVLIYLASVRVNIPSVALALGFKLILFALFPLLLYAAGFFEHGEVDKLKSLMSGAMTRYRARAVAVNGR